jgi:hypothetical protein
LFLLIAEALPGLHGEVCKTKFDRVAGFSRRCVFATRFTWWIRNFEYTFPAGFSRAFLSFISRRYFCVSAALTFHMGIRGRSPFEAIENLSVLMVFLLPGKVVDHPGKLLFPEGDGAESPLPFQGATALAAIAFARGRAFQIGHDVTQAEGRLDLECHVYVSRGPADAVEKDPAGVATARFEKCVYPGFTVGSQGGPASLGVPVQVDKQLVVGVGGHG